MKLALFFTSGVSLQDWDRIGLLERECSLYLELQRRGVEVSFITYGDAKELTFSSKIPGIKILYNKWRLPKVIYKFLIPIIFLKELRTCDIFKSNQMDGAEVPLLASKLLGKPIIARCGYMWGEFIQQTYKKNSFIAKKTILIEKLVFSMADKIVVTTAAMVRRIFEDFPNSTSCVTVVPNYVDTKLFSPHEGIEKDIDLIFVGRLSEQKNIVNLLNAIRPLNIRTVLIGNGELITKVQEMMPEISGDTLWYPKVANSDLPKLFHRARAFILPSFYEGHPKALLEAMSCELPVIGANSPGIRELIEHGRTGWLCETGTRSIQDSILHLLNNPGLRKELGTKAREFVCSNFALEKIVEEELALVHDVAHKRKRS